jgi:DNA repair protein RadD
MSFPTPRDFQQVAHEKLRDGLRSGHRCQMLMAPTGAGKTYLGMRIAKEALEKGKRAVFLCDRKTLIEQTSATADIYGMSDHGVIQGDHWRTDYAKRFQIASAQTLARRQWPDADVIIVDEAHTQLKAWTEFIPTTKAAVIGLSATPFSAGLGKLFSNLVNAATMAELTESGVLVPMKVYSCTSVNMDGAATAGGEWTDAAAAERGMEILGDVVAEWHKFGERRKTIVFGATIAHCEALCQQFTASGTMAALFTSDTTPAERKALLDEYRKPNSILKVLISVEALAKGFDVPDVSCVVDCRPLRKSLSTAIQMWGRGLRSSPDTGKTNCILLDHSGNIIRFREDFEAIYHNGLDALDHGEKLDKVVRKDDEEKQAKECPSCGYKPFFKRCMGCGFENKSMSDVSHLSGVMQEVLIGGKKAADNNEHLWRQLTAYVLDRGKQQTRQGRAAHLYKDIVGAWPPREYLIDFTDPAPISKAVMNKIYQKNIAYAKARQAEIA